MTNETGVRKAVILCIDDEVPNVFIRKLVLESEGYSVLVAHSGRDGLTMLKVEEVDVVILDYVMPEMNGGDVAEEIRRIKPAVPILMLSGSLDIPPSVAAVVDACASKAESPTGLCYS